MYTNKINEIMLRRKNCFYPAFYQPISFTESTQKNILDSAPDAEMRIVMAATIAKNMEALGYVPSKKLFYSMLDNENVIAIVNDCVIPTLKVLKGANVSYHPLYPNFPKQVMEMSYATLYINAILHYFTVGKWAPTTDKAIRKDLSETVKLKKIEVCDEGEIKSLYSDLLNSSTPWSEQDIEDINTLSDHYLIGDYMPSFMKNRENLALLAGNAITQNNTKMLSAIKKQIKTVTDVLRIMNVNHGNGDPTLKNDKLHITKISRPERKMYLALINDCKNASEDMKINRTVWVKVGQGLHPGEYRNAYPKAFTAFNEMRNNELAKQVETYNAKVEKSISSNNMESMRETFINKPGMMARNLDRLLRESANPESILDLWKIVAYRVDPALLWQVYAHFVRKVDEMDEDNKLRIFVLANKNARTVVKEDTTKPISVEICNEVIRICMDALQNLYEDKPQMGKVYIDPEISRCKIPNGTRGAQTALAKGSRLPINKNANIIRAYVWWTNLPNYEEVSLYDWSDGRVDIDLSAAMLNENLALLDRISYYNLKPLGNYAYHSGDIVDGGMFNGPGAAEFVDIDIKESLALGIKYICFTVSSYSEQPFSKMEHCHFGWMERENPQSGEIFEPATVKNNIKLTANSNHAIMCMFDLENREVIWMDEIGQDLFRSHRDCNNIDANIKGSTMSCYKVLHLEKPNIEDVIKLNVLARGGEIVDNKNDADLVFALDGDVTPMNSEYFSGNLIPKDVSKVFAENTSLNPFTDE